MNTGLLAHIAKGDGSLILKLHGVVACQHPASVSADTGSEECRRRKVKCNGQQPCRRCGNLDLTCLRALLGLINRD
jgi:hypothetical protein